MRQIKVELQKRTDRPTMKDIKEMNEWVTEMISEDKYWQKAQKDRYKFTKVNRSCEQCGEKLDARSDYHMKYGFCDVGCGNRLFGLVC